MLFIHSLCRAELNGVRPLGLGDILTAMDYFNPPYGWARCPTHMIGNKISSQGPHTWVRVGVELSTEGKELIMKLAGGHYDLKEYSQDAWIAIPWPNTLQQGENEFVVRNTSCIKELKDIGLIAVMQPGAYRLTDAGRECASWL